MEGRIDETEEEIDTKKINPKYVELGLIILTIILFMYVGMAIGYIQGYTYVKEFKENYEKQHCICQNIPINSFGFFDTNLTGKEKKIVLLPSSPEKSNQS